MYKWIVTDLDVSWKDKVREEQNHVWQEVEDEGSVETSHKLEDKAAHFAHLASVRHGNFVGVSVHQLFAVLSKVLPVTLVHLNH